ncbi:MAG: hypothetical protein ABIP93_03840, partial [Gemmatimonadaceae bacterium]
MNALIVAVALLVGVLVLIFARSAHLAIALRRAGKDLSREYDMPRVAQYVEGLSPAVSVLPLQTWNDLDMDQLFQSIDRTSSWPGQHLLYARLRREDHSLDSVRQFEAAVSHVVGAPDVGERIRQALTPLASSRASALPLLFQAELPEVPTLARLAPALSVLGAALMIVAFWWPPFLLGIVALAFLNTYIRISTRDRIARALPAAGMVPTLQSAARELARLDAPALSQLTSDLIRSSARLPWIARAARWLSFDPTSENELVGYIYEYINLLLILDVSVFVWT